MTRPILSGILQTFALLRNMHCGRKQAAHKPIPLRHGMYVAVACVKTSINYPLLVSIEAVYICLCVCVCVCVCVCAFWMQSKCLSNVSE